jgi:type I restriction enzyme, S subunit
VREGWQTKQLGELCELYQPKTISKSEMTDEGEYPVFGANGIIGRYNQYNHEDPELIITCRGATCGSVNISEPKSWITGNAMVVRPRDNRVVRGFLEYFFRGGVDISQVITGSAQPQITRQSLAPVIVAFPSLSEQKRIVAILDEAFDGIGAATANAVKNLANACELFESYLQAVFTDVWESSELVSLSELATDITDGDHLPPPKAVTGVPFITIGNINKETRTIDFTDTFMVPHEYFNGSKANRKPKNGDVLYTVTGSFGIPVIVEDDFKFCFQRHIGLIRPKAETQSAWLYYLLLSPQVFKQANGGATGTAQKTVSLKVLRSFKVPRVSPPQQRSAVTILDTLAAETKRLEAIYQQKLASLAELKQSILQKAFAGELTAQPEQFLQEAVA